MLILIACFITVADKPYMAIKHAINIKITNSLLTKAYYYESKKR